MVMDIRQLWSADEPPHDAAKPHADADKSTDAAAQPVNPPPTLAASTVMPGVDAAVAESSVPNLDPSKLDFDLEGLITQVAEGDAQARAQAAADVRALVPGADGIALFFRLAADVDDVRRLPAIQALGHHRHWLSSRSRLDKILHLARDERDPEVAAALVWTLRQRDELREFLLHPMYPVAREAALGVPLSAHTVEAVVHAMLVGRAVDIDVILAQKLPTIHASLTPLAIEVLLRMAADTSAQDQRQVLDQLPQPPLFEALVEGRSRPALNPEPTAQQTQALMHWQDLSRLTAASLLDRPRCELIRYLVHRCAAEETFARRHASFLHKAMTNTHDVLGAEILDDFERLTRGASEERLERMALLLMELVDNIAGGESHPQAADLLEKWKNHSPSLKLKIYHIQQGLR